MKIKKNKKEMNTKSLSTKQSLKKGKRTCTTHSSSCCTNPQAKKPKVSSSSSFCYHPKIHRISVICRQELARKLRIGGIQYFRSLAYQKPPVPSELGQLALDETQFEKEFYPEYCSHDVDNTDNTKNRDDDSYLHKHYLSRYAVYSYLWDCKYHIYGDACRYKQKQRDNGKEFPIKFPSKDANKNNDCHAKRIWKVEHPSFLCLYDLTMSKKEENKEEDSLEGKRCDTSPFSSTTRHPLERELEHRETSLTLSPSSFFVTMLAAQHPLMQTECMSLPKHVRNIAGSPPNQRRDSSSFSSPFPASSSPSPSPSPSSFSSSPSPFPRRSPSGSPPASVHKENDNRFLGSPSPFPIVETFGEAETKDNNKQNQRDENKKKEEEEEEEEEMQRVEETQVKPKERSDTTNAWNGKAKKKNPPFLHIVSPEKGLFYDSSSMRFPQVRTPSLSRHVLRVCEYIARLMHQPSDDPDVTLYCLMNGPFMYDPFEDQLKLTPVPWWDLFLMSRHMVYTRKNDPPSLREYWLDGWTTIDTTPFNTKDAIEDRDNPGYVDHSRLFQFSQVIPVHPVFRFSLAELHQLKLWWGRVHPEWIGVMYAVQSSDFLFSNQQFSDVLVPNKTKCTLCPIDVSSKNTPNSKSEQEEGGEGEGASSSYCCSFHALSSRPSCWKKPTTWDTEKAEEYRAYYFAVFYKLQNPNEWIYCDPFCEYPYDFLWSYIYKDLEMHEKNINEKEEEEENDEDGSNNEEMTYTDRNGNSSSFHDSSSPLWIGAIDPWALQYKIQAPIHSHTQLETVLWKSSNGCCGSVGGSLDEEPYVMRIPNPANMPFTK